MVFLFSTRTNNPNPYFLLKCSNEEKQEEKKVFVYMLMWKYEHRHRGEFSVVLKELDVPEYANAALSALVFTPDSNVYKHITDRSLHIFAYICIYACTHWHTTVCLTDLRKNNALDSWHIQCCSLCRWQIFLCSVWSFLSGKHTATLIKVGKQQFLLVLFTLLPLLG